MKKIIIMFLLSFGSINALADHAIIGIDGTPYYRCSSQWAQSCNNGASCNTSDGTCCCNGSAGITQNGAIIYKYTSVEVLQPSKPTSSDSNKFQVQLK